MQHLNKTTFAKATDSGMCLVVVSKSNCAPCAQMEPILEKLSATYPIYKLKVDEGDNRDLAVKMNVRSAPTMIFMVDGMEANRVIGATTEANLIEIFESL